MSIDKNSFDGSLQTKGAFFRGARLDVVQEQINSAAKQFLDLEKGCVLPNLTEERVCVVCGSAKRRMLFLKNLFPHVQCEECAFVYVNPILKEAELISYYRGVSGSWADVTEKQEYNAFQSRYYQFHLDLIAQHSRSPVKTILDIGCNNGEFLSAAKAQGWTVTGHELNTYAGARARNKGIEVFDRPLEAALFEGRKFGAVTLLGVLEHLPRPEHFLEVVKAVLEPGGVLAAMVPNIDSLTTRVLRDKCNTFDGIEHINFWGRSTFARFFEKCGFTVAHSETTISELYTLNNFLHYEHPYSAPVELPLLLDVLTPEYIHERGLGHHLCAYARRS